MAVSLTKRLTINASLFLCFLAGRAQTTNQQVNSDPDKALIVTADIDNFWRAFDLAAKETDTAKKIAIYQAEYFDKGSVGLQDFVRLRIKSAQDLVTAIDKMPRFYAAVRPSSRRVAEMEKELRQNFYKFKQLYPNAVFPDIYFLIGVASTGGTTSRNGLLIGAELCSLTPQTPRDEFAGMLKTFLPQEEEKQIQLLGTRYFETSVKPVDNIPSIVVHELCHFNQKFPEPKNLLGKALQEGPCDFISEVIVGKVMNPVQKTYGNQHEKELWQTFKTQMHENKIQDWFYNLMSAKDKPSDLGYYMGYKISQAYYQNAKNKKEAIKDILEISDFDAFLAKSRYPDKFGK
jgi:hypothetical protein